MTTEPGSRWHQGGIVQPTPPHGMDEPEWISPIGPPKTTKQLWQRRLAELDAETNPYPAGSTDAAWWALNHACRRIGATWALLIAPVIDHIARIVEDR